MRVTTEFISCGCNRVVNALDWGDGGLVAYGGSSIVCVYDPATARIVGTLTGHAGQVNCVKWVPAAALSGRLPAGCSLLLSGAADATICVWAWYGTDAAPASTLLHTIKGAAATPVTSLAVHATSPDTFLLAATSADPHVHVWSCAHGRGSAAPAARAAASPAHAGVADADDDAAAALLQRFGDAAWRLEQQLPVDGALQHCAALAALPGSPGWLVLATGGTDCKVRLWVRGPRVDARAAADSAAAPATEGSPPAAAEQPPAGFQAACQLAGHENWVRCVAFAAVCEERPGSAPALLLASASQDRYSRLWCIQQEAGGQLAAAAGSAPAGKAQGGDDVAAIITRYAPRPLLRAGPTAYSATLEALLIGHEDWVHNVCWCVPGSSGASAAGAPAARAAAPGAPPPPRARLRLVSTSQDRTMMMWRYDAPNALWVNCAIVGDAGATCLGYYGGSFSPDGGSLIAHGFTGALHLWRRAAAPPGRNDGAADAADPAAGAVDAWVPHHALGGHFGAVLDVAWGADGRCVQSVACDQTARLFADVNGHWCELARTQVHGHDFSCIAPIPARIAPEADGAGAGAVNGSATYLYASGSEEKVVRVLEAPTAFLDTLALARGRTPGGGRGAGPAAGSAAAGNNVNRDGRAFGAAVGALSLSNKALYAPQAGDAAAAAAGDSVGASDGAAGPDLLPCAAPAAVSGPPLEEHLSQNTLWPEIRKLYGHGNEVHCLAASPDGRWLASASRAQSAATAVIWVWDAASWRPAAQLAAHTLTVTQLAFSNSGRQLLAGSRDRSFSVWAAPAAGAAAAAAWTLVARVRAAHARIIWGVAWAPDDRYVVTCSRDQTVKVWVLAPGGVPPPRPTLTLPVFDAAVTTVALSGRQRGREGAPSPASTSAAAAPAALLAVGLESGGLEVWEAVVDDDQGARVQRLWHGSGEQRHAAALRRVAWQARPEVGDAPLLASCGDDHTVRLFRCAVE